MKRFEEYEALMADLENCAPVELEDTLVRAQKKKMRREKIYRPFIGVAAVMLLFVLMVNFSTPIAYACSKVPILRELAEAVRFSPSLTDAVKNDYVQPMNLVQMDGEVSAKVEYLIVDQKQVNVFYRLYSDVYENMNADPRVMSADGSSPPPCSYGVNDWDVPNGELQSVNIDFVEENVPESLRLQLKIRDFSMSAQEAPIASVEEQLFNPQAPEEEEYIAEFDFLLEFDPQFTAAGKKIEVNQTVELEGQNITIVDVEIYPSHLRVNVMDDTENTAWLKRLDFYVETDWGMKFETISEGITATGTDGRPSLESFRAESNYFYEADKLKIVITGAEWLRKDMEKVYLNLETGENGGLPEGVSFLGAEKMKSGWLLKLKAVQRKENHFHQILTHKFYDAEGKEYEIRSWSSYNEDMEEGTEEILYMIEEVPLVNFHDTEVWLMPHYSHEWTAENPVVVVVQ